VQDLLDRLGLHPVREEGRLETGRSLFGVDAGGEREVVDRGPEPAGEGPLMAADRTINRLIQGFMGLGLIVGVAALGVISARAVVERRQQIGVLRAIGFRRGMVQGSS
jgi:ABC-type antimicrobial peptide transport system permease subunit